MRRKRYWEVETAFYDDGHVIANIMQSKLYEEAPKGHCSELRKCDVYVDYYPSLAAARQAVQEARMA